MQDINNPSFGYVDFWDADMCAIGLINRSDTNKLMYISTYGKKDNFYDYEFEVGNIEAGETETLESGKDVDYVTLREKIVNLLDLL